MGPLVLPQEGMLPGMKVRGLAARPTLAWPASWRDCGRGGVIITRSAVHRPGPHARRRYWLR
jgi:hypothetical protein